MTDDIIYAEEQQYLRLAENIRGVCLQKYSDLKYIDIDGEKIESNASYRITGKQLAILINENRFDDIFTLVKYQINILSDDIFFELIDLDSLRNFIYYAIDRIKKAPNIYHQILYLCASIYTTIKNTNHEYTIIPRNFFDYCALFLSKDVTIFEKNIPADKYEHSDLYFSKFSDIIMNDIIEDPGRFVIGLPDYEISRISVLIYYQSFFDISIVINFLSTIRHSDLAKIVGYIIYYIDDIDKVITLINKLKIYDIIYDLSANSTIDKISKYHHYEQLQLIQLRNTYLHRCYAFYDRTDFYFEILEKDILKKSRTNETSAKDFVAQLFFLIKKSDENKYTLFDLCDRLFDLYSTYTNIFNSCLSDTIGGMICASDNIDINIWLKYLVEWIYIKFSESKIIILPSIFIHHLAWNGIQSEFIEECIKNVIKYEGYNIDLKCLYHSNIPDTIRLAIKYDNNPRTSNFYTNILINKLAATDSFEKIYEIFLENGININLNKLDLNLSWGCFLTKYMILDPRKQDIVYKNICVLITLQKKHNLTFRNIDRYVKALLLSYCFDPHFIIKDLKNIFVDVTKVTNIINTNDIDQMIDIIIKISNNDIIYSFKHLTFEIFEHMYYLYLYDKYESIFYDPGDAE